MSNLSLLQKIHIETQRAETAENSIDNSLNTMNNLLNILDASFGVVNNTINAILEGADISLDSLKEIVEYFDNVDTSFVIKLNNLSQDVELINTHLGVIDNSLGLVDASLVALDNSFSALDTRIGAIDSSFSALDSSFSALDNSFSALDTRIVAIDTSLGLVDASLVALETTMNNMNMSKSTFSFIVEHEGDFIVDQYIGSFGYSSNSSSNFGLPLPCKMSLIGYKMSLDNLGNLNYLPTQFSLKLLDTMSHSLTINSDISDNEYSYSISSTNPIDESGNSISFEDQLIFQIFSIDFSPGVDHSNVTMRLTLLFRSDIDLPS